MSLPCEALINSLIYLFSNAFYLQNSEVQLMLAAPLIVQENIYQQPTDGRGSP